MKKKLTNKLAENYAPPICNEMTIDFHEAILTGSTEQIADDIDYEW